MISKTSTAYNNILVSVVIRHYIYRSLSNPDSRDSIVALRPKGYYHRGLAINALNEDIRKCDIKHTGMLIAAVVSFISAEVKSSSPLCLFLRSLHHIRPISRLYRTMLTLDEISSRNRPHRPGSTTSKP